MGLARLEVFTGGGGGDRSRGDVLGGGGGHFAEQGVRGGPEGWASSDWGWEWNLLGAPEEAGEHIWLSFFWWRGRDVDGFFCEWEIGYWIFGIMFLSIYPLLSPPPFLHIRTPGIHPTHCGRKKIVTSCIFEKSSDLFQNPRESESGTRIVPIEMTMTMTMTVGDADDFMTLLASFWGDLRAGKSDRSG